MSTTKITLPELGEGVDSVDVVSVLVKKGDTIAVDQPLIEVETEKAAVEVPATAAGTVTEVHVEEGQSLGPDAPIVTVETDDAETQPAAAADDEPAEGDEPEELTEVADGEASPDETQPIEADDSDRDSGSGSGGDSGSDEDSGSGKDSGSDEDSDQDSDRDSDSEQQPEKGSAATPSRSQVPKPSGTLVPAAPSVRRFAREVGVDITTVDGSGPGGRISIDDVKAEANRRLSRGAGAGGFAPPAAELPDFSRWGEVRREKMSKVRSVTAEAMTRAWLTAPQVTNHELADISELEDLRKAYKGRVESAGGKLTMTAILIKIAASALKVFPDLNASIDPDAGEIVYKDYINVGVAVDTEHGLLVPVVKNADAKNITEIAVELGDLAERARSRKLKPDEMQGGTFSISNLGGIGGTGFSPIVNWPEVAILGVSRSRVQPEWDDELEEFFPRRMLPLSLSYDHRLVDGAEAARFLAWVAEALESPLLLALEG